MSLRVGYVIILIINYCVISKLINVSEYRIRPIFAVYSVNFKIIFKLVSLIIFWELPDLKFVEIQEK